MKKIIAIFALISLASCANNWAKKEVETTAKASAASTRINASENNSHDVFKELDQ
jgi:hypothetical protein